MLMEIHPLYNGKLYVFAHFKTLWPKFSPQLTDAALLELVGLQRCNREDNLDLYVHIFLL